MPEPQSAPAVLFAAAVAVAVADRCCLLPLSLSLSLTLSEIHRNTGLLPRSASPPLQLASLRRPTMTSCSNTSRSPPVVSAAFIVTVARFSALRFPGVPPLRMCSSRLGRQRHILKDRTPAGRPFLVLSGARESRASRRTRTPARAGATVTSGAGATRGGCRAAAGRPPGEGRSTLFQRCPAPARAKRRTRRGRLPVACAAAGQQGVEPERRRDERRTRRQAGVPEKPAKGSDRFSATDSSHPP
jgi:hypothetical protein